MPALVAALAVALSTHAVGAAPVSVSIHATYEMQCGWPGPSIAVVFPAAERLPARIDRTAVLVNGAPPASVARTGRTVTLTIARPTGVLCDAIAPGTVRVVFTRAARLGNPRAAGTYTIEVRHRAAVLRGHFSVR